MFNCYPAAKFTIFSHCVCSQRCTLLHLCLVQQYRDRWAAPPAGDAGHQRQLQRDRARGTRRPARQNRSQRLLGARRGHRRLLSRLPWQLGRVHDHGRKTERSHSNRPGVRNWFLKNKFGAYGCCSGHVHWMAAWLLSLWWNFACKPERTDITGLLQLLSCPDFDTKQ